MTDARHTIAFFDFDDTIAKGDSIVPYLLYCIKTSKASPVHLMKAMIGMLLQRLPGFDPMLGKKCALSFIRGRSVK